MFNTGKNLESLAVELDLVEEVKSEARVHGKAYRRTMTRKFNSKLKKQSFKANNMVWRLRGDAKKDNSNGKLVPN